MIIHIITHQLRQGWLLLLTITSSLARELTLDLLESLLDLSLCLKTAQTIIKIGAKLGEELTNIEGRTEQKNKESIEKKQSWILIIVINTLFYVDKLEPSITFNLNSEGFDRNIKNWITIKRNMIFFWWQ